MLPLELLDLELDQEGERAMSLDAGWWAPGGTFTQGRLPSCRAWQPDTQLRRQRNWHPLLAVTPAGE